MISGGKTCSKHIFVSHPVATFVINIFCNHQRELAAQLTDIYQSSVKTGHAMNWHLSINNDVWRLGDLSVHSQWLLDTWRREICQPLAMDKKSFMWLLSIIRTVGQSMNWRMLSLMTARHSVNWHLSIINDEWTLGEPTTVFLVKEERVTAEEGRLGRVRPGWCCQMWPNKDESKTHENHSIMLRVQLLHVSKTSVTWLQRCDTKDFWWYTKETEDP